MNSDKLTTSLRPGIAAALASAVLFGAGTPLAKWLLDQVSPWMLAGLLYLGSGIGLAIYRWVRGAARPRLKAGETRWLVAAIVCGGGVAPALLMWGLSAMPASHVSLLLNAEAVLTAVLAWMVFKENVDRRIAAGMGLIVAGAVLLSWPQGESSRLAQAAPALFWPACAVLLACLFWALDNNFTRKVSLADPSWIASVKGLAAGTTNLLLAFLVGGVLPGPVRLAAAMAVGLFSYGVSLALFVVALRHLGASRAGAYFSTAPFVGALFSIFLLGDSLTWQLCAAAALMGLGIWLHLTEHHEHAHQHQPLQHEHEHSHPDQDAHHTHEHVPAFLGSHSHAHQHEAMQHSHAHYPDAHHRHEH